MPWPGNADRRAARANAELAAERLGLFSDRARGPDGGVLGTGSGSSVEYASHRPYLLGDDPRHLDWAAAGRSDALLLRTFRREVSPRIDLAIDLSHSMSVDREKAMRTLELVWFVRAVAERAHWALAMYSVIGAKVERLEEGSLFDDRTFPKDDARLDPIELSRVPWRSGARRVLISDLLQATAPRTLLAPMTGPTESAVLLVPHTIDERDPGWSGELELVDVESGRSRAEAITPELLARHRRAYDRHFDAWRSEARRVRVGLVRIRAEGALLESLAEEGITSGVVTPWS
jgi:uncharacterized protein (DUF58 family)